MEFQLKERLIGAAVLLAVAVVMVPEIFSGPRSRPPAATESESASSGQLKTYRIELQSQPRPATAASVDEPAERPQDEVSSAAGPTEPTITDEASSSSSSVFTQATNASVPKPPVPAKPVESTEPEKTDKPVTKPTSKPADVIAKPTADGWVVQVGSFAAQDKAQGIAKTLKSQGYSAYVGPVKVGNKTLYRVRVGAAADRPSAEITLRKLKATYPAASVVPTSR